MFLRFCSLALEQEVQIELSTSIIKTQGKIT